MKKTKTFRVVLKVVAYYDGMTAEDMESFIDESLHDGWFDPRTEIVAVEEVVG